MNEGRLHSASRRLLAGPPPSEARGALVLLHGRGSSADDILGLVRHLDAQDLACIAPSAEGGTWYPQRFLAPLEYNEPWLSSALSVVNHVVNELNAAGIPDGRIGLIGFSQGACLVLEHLSRTQRPHAFVAGLSGALIGPLETQRPPGDLGRQPVLLACSEGDAHIPLEFVDRSQAVFESLNADVTRHNYPGSAHRLFPSEVEWIKERCRVLGR